MILQDLDDIEDIHISLAEEQGGRSAAQRPSYVNRKGKETSAEKAASVEQVVPGTQSVWVKTFGCSHNTSDSEYMVGTLSTYMQGTAHAATHSTAHCFQRHWWAACKLCCAWAAGSACCCWLARTCVAQLQTLHMHLRHSIGEPDAMPDSVSFRNRAKLSCSADGTAG